MYPLTTERKNTVFKQFQIWDHLQSFKWAILGKSENSLKFWIDMLKKDSIKPQFNAVSHLIENQTYQEAREYLEGLVNNKEDSAQISYYLARCFLGQGFVLEALQEIEKAMSAEPQNALYFELMADCLLEQGNWRSAVEALNKSLRANPKRAETVFRLGLIYSYHGEYVEALRCFQGCCELQPRKSVYWEMKAETHLKLEQITQACTSYERALRYGVDPDLATRLAYCYTQVGKIKQGIRYYLLVLKHEPDHYEALCNLAAVYQNQGRSLDALNLQEKALVICPNDPILLNNYAYTLVNMGRTRRATEYYKEALKIARNHPLILYNLATCHVQRGNWDAGIVTLEQLLEIEPEHTEGLILLGNVYEQLAKYEQAVDCFNRALKLA